jgi:hypothetical protein
VQRYRDFVKPVDLLGVHVEATSGTPLVLLQEQDEPHRVLPIFIGGPEATSIALAISGHVPARPLTHDLMARLVETLDATVDAVEVTGLRDGTFLAELALTVASDQRRVDSRPSDAIALAVRVGAPVFVSDVVLDLAGVTLRTTDDGIPDEESIDEAVAEFRRVLDDIDPADFVQGLPGRADPSTPRQRTDPTDEAVDQSDAEESG